MDNYHDIHPYSSHILPSLRLSFEPKLEELEMEQAGGTKASGVARYHISGLTPHVVSANTTTRGESVSKERIMAAVKHNTTESDGRSRPGKR